MVVAAAVGRLLRVLRIDETWHRLREWTAGSAVSERLAAQILLAEGFTGVDPAHPLGGPDRGRDGLASRDGELWVYAVYFPRRQRSFGEIKAKLIADCAGATRAGAAGIVFLTNQELSGSQRRQLERAIPVVVELLHLERLVTILDQPGMYGVREQFLGIPVPGGDPGDGVSPDPGAVVRLEAELRHVLSGELGFLSTRGLPRELRRGEPRLSMTDAFVPLRVLLSVRALVRDALESLSYRERRVLELRIGFGGERPVPVDEVARVFSLTRERVRSIESAALERCRETLERSGQLAALGVELDEDVTLEMLQTLHMRGPVLELLGVRRLVVLGGPGSGKSTLTRYLAWALAQQRTDLPPALLEMLPLRLTVPELAEALAPASGLLEVAFARAGRFAPVLRSAAEQDRLLLILDGLDEVNDPSLAEQVHDALNSFLADPAHAGVGLLLTSRIVGFDVLGPLAELPTATLAALERDQMRRLLHTWFAQIHGVEAAALTTALMRRLMRDRRMLELAGNPLLLTVLALLQARHRQLPNERAQLYAAATETLIDSWPKRRGGQLSYDTATRWLAPLARTALLAPREDGVPEDDVLDILAGSWQTLFGGPPASAREQARLHLDSLRDDSGLLNVTGHSAEGLRLWDFLHRSFAEYLVACDLAEVYLRGECDPVSLAHQDGRHEVLLMMLGELGRRRPALVGPLLDRLATAASTPWEEWLRLDLRLALSVLARDVPCEEEHARALIDRALAVCAASAIAPLREDLERLLAALNETRHAALLEQRAAASPLPFTDVLAQERQPVATRDTRDQSRPDSDREDPRLAALEARRATDPLAAVKGLAEILHGEEQRDLRLRAIELLSESRGSQQALLEALDDPDQGIATQAALALLPGASDAQDTERISRAVLDGRVQIDPILDGLARWARPEHLQVALGLLRDESSAARRLGARMLAVNPAPESCEHAIKLIDDHDSTVRCAAVCKLTFTAQTSGELPPAIIERLLRAIPKLLADQDRIDEPALEDPQEPFRDASTVWCCADAAYRLLAQHPALLRQALGLAAGT